MTFAKLAKYFQELEKISSRNAMTEILVKLFTEADKNEIGQICYLLQGRVAPLFEAIEFGMAEKMVIKAITAGCGADGNEVNREFKKVGDLGKVVESLKPSAGNSKLSVGQVFEVLENTANKGGAGSVEIKVNLLADLLRKVDSLSARYIVRIPIAKMRLGFSDMTILDSLSWMAAGDKSKRAEIEKAYNVRPDLSFIAKTIKEKGVKGLTEVQPKVGVPILMARAERLSSGKEIIDKIGKCGVEPKIDGFRLQVHYKKSGFDKPTFNKLLEGKQQGFDFVPSADGTQTVRLFTRNLEEVTFMYPDIVAGIEKQIKAKEVIFEGEAVAYNPKTGEYLPFQETVQRKRKYGIEKMTKDVPLRLLCFDVLLKEGENLLTKPYAERRKKLEEIIHKGETIVVVEEQEVADPERLEQIFQDAIKRKLEGVMAKKLDGVYQAGARGWNWIKYKKSYDSKIDDNIDGVVMGYDFGQGKRTGFGIGAFLIGVYDKTTDSFKTIAKIGTGLTDEEWKTLKVHSEKLKVKSKPNRYDTDKMMECDMWVNPKIVVVIKADEITRSPVHTAGREMQKTKGGALRQAQGKEGAEEVKIQGFALRFPRLVDFRTDKAPEDATSVNEIEKMYKIQKK